MSPGPTIAHISTLNRRDALKGASALAVGSIASSAAFAAPASASAWGAGPVRAKGMGTTGVGQPLRLVDLARRQPGPKDVLIDILYAGVCHTDWHQAGGEWPGGNFPMVPGHEIVGRVSEVGSRVTKYRKGDLVGVGNYTDSCRECAPCHAGREIYCENGVSWTYNGKERTPGAHAPSGLPTFGGYSTAITVDENYVLRVPEGIDVRGAAPLLCAGITTYSPLAARKVGPGHRVGIVGFGGLGHVGTQIAKAMGAHVTVFTTTSEKAADARRLGADVVVVSTDEAAMKAAAASIDTLLDTIPEPHDLAPYIALTRLDGYLWILGAVGPAPMPQGIVGGQLGSKGRAIASSYCGGIAETQEMLDFCGKHRISAVAEVIPPSGVNETRERIKNKQVRYRYVLEMSQVRA